jgi:hypothetical protein
MFFLVIGILHLPLSSFSNALAKLVISTNHEERQTTFIKPVVLRLPQSKHTPQSFKLN